MKNDLHIRTNFSASANKEDCYKHVLQKCEQAGLDKIAITDFDTCIFHVLNKVVDTSQYFSGKIVAGMECDVCDNGKTFELLAYNFDVFKTMEWSYNIYGTLETRQTKIKDYLLNKARRNNLVIDESIVFNGKTDFAHNYLYSNLKVNESNNWLFEKYNIKTMTDFYNLSTADTSCPLYIDMGAIWPTTSQVVDFIHSVGGIVVLGNIYKHKELDADTLIEHCIQNGVDGIEVYHPLHTKEQVSHLLEIAQTKNLIITGGSNYNGLKFTELGINNIDEKQQYISDL